MGNHETVGVCTLLEVVNGVLGMPCFRSPEQVSLVFLQAQTALFHQ